MIREGDRLFVCFLRQKWLLNIEVPLKAWCPSTQRQLHPHHTTAAAIVQYSSLRPLIVPPNSCPTIPERPQRWDFVPESCGLEPCAPGLTRKVISPLGWSWGWCGKTSNRRKAKDSNTGSRSSYYVLPTSHPWLYFTSTRREILQDSLFMQVEKIMALWGSCLKSHHQ